MSQRYAKNAQYQNSNNIRFNKFNNNSRKFNHENSITKNEQLIENKEIVVAADATASDVSIQNMHQVTVFESDHDQQVHQQQQQQSSFDDDNHNTSICHQQQQIPCIDHQTPCNQSYPPMFYATTASASSGIEYDCNNNLISGNPNGSPYYVAYQPAAYASSDAQYHHLMATPQQQATNYYYQTAAAYSPYVYDTAGAYVAASTHLTSPQPTGVLASYHQTPLQQAATCPIYISTDNLSDSGVSSGGQPTTSTATTLTTSSSSPGVPENHQIIGSVCNSPSQSSQLSTFAQQQQSTTTAGYYGSQYVIYQTPNPYHHQLYQSPMPTSQTTYMMYAANATPCHQAAPTTSQTTPMMQNVPMYSQDQQQTPKFNQRFNQTRNRRNNNNQKYQSNLDYTPQSLNFSQSMYLSTPSSAGSNGQCCPSECKPDQPCCSASTINATPLLEQQPSTMMMMYTPHSIYTQTPPMSTCASTCEIGGLSNTTSMDPSMTPVFPGYDTYGMLQAYNQYTQSGGMIESYGYDNDDEYNTHNRNRCLGGTSADNDDDVDDWEEADKEQLACYVCRGRRMCFCYFLKVRYYKFPSFLDLVDYQYKKWKSTMKKQQQQSMHSM